jgi:hypothetical protein
MAQIYYYIAQVMMWKNNYSQSEKYCNAVLHWGDKRLIKKYKLAATYYNLSLIARKRKQLNK